jgi:hemerythrin
MNQDLITGINDLDKQHQAFYDHLDLLLDYVRRGQGKSAISSTLQFLESYALEHFDNEVRYMKQYHYPDLLQHRAEHEAFLKDIAAFKEKYAALQVQGEMTTFLGLEIVRKLNFWFDHHVLNVDKKMGAFLMERMGSE